MKTIRAFLLGMWEFRCSYTTHVGGRYVESYDWGRELAHRATFRRFEQ